jgi:hypothetical protein
VERNEGACGKKNGPKALLPKGNLRRGIFEISETKNPLFNENSAW